MAKLANPSIKFAGTTYNTDDCIQNARLTVNGAEVTFQCNGYEKVEVGNKSIRLSFSLAMDVDDVTQAGALAVGQTGTCEFHPGGDSAGNIEHLTTAAYVLSHDSPADPNTAIMADVVMAWNTLTTGIAGA